MPIKLMPAATLAVAAAMVVAGCAAPGGTEGPAGGQAPPAGGADLGQVCSPVAVGAGAAALCGLVAQGNNRVRAAAVCAAAAVTACYLANSYKAEQTRSAQQVQDEFLRRNRQLPERTTVTDYRSTVEPAGPVRRGQEVRLTSTIVVVPGRDDRSVRVEEEIGLVDGRGETWGRPVRKLASGSQGGEFRTSFTVPVSESMSQGVYTLRRSLYVNGSAVRRDDANARFQVVQAGGGETLALLAVP